MKSGPVDIITVLEVVNFLQYEGKTTFDSVERLLVERIMDAINKKKFSLGTELMIAAILSRAHNFTNTFQQKVAKKLTKDSAGSLFTKFDASNGLNQRLIETCVNQEIFANDNHYYVKMQLMIFCQKLHDLQSSVSSYRVIRVIEYKFTAEEIPSQTVGKRKSAVDPSSVPTKKIQSENASEETSAITLKSSTSQQMIKMEYKIYAAPRTAFQWLDDTSVVVRSIDALKYENGHCVHLDTRTTQSKKIDVDKTFVYSVARVSKDKFITGSMDGTVCLFVDSAIRKTRKFDRLPLVEFINGEIVVATSDGKLSILDESLESKRDFDAGPGAETEFCQSISGNETFIAVGYIKGTVRYWRTNGGKESVICKYVRYWRTNDGKEPVIYKHDKRVTSVSAQGNLLASGSYDETVQLWNMQTNRKVMQFQHEDQAICVQLHDNLLISSSWDKSTRIWNIKTGNQLYKLSHSSQCNNFDLDASQTVLAVACDTEVVLWDFKKATKIKEFKLGNTISDVRFNPAGDTLVAGVSDGRVFKIDLEFGSKDQAA